jgi:hypothetical protein
MADIFARNGYEPAGPDPPRKIGQGHLEAMGRLGLKELRNAANPSHESVADTEMGLYGTVGPAEAARQQGVTHAPSHDPTPQQQPSYEPPERGRGY